MNWISILILCIVVVAFGVCLFFLLKGKHGGCCGDCSKCKNFCKDEGKKSLNVKNQTDKFQDNSQDNDR